MFSIEEDEFDLSPDDALSSAGDTSPQETIQPQGPPSLQKEKPF